MNKSVTLKIDGKVTGVIRYNKETMVTFQISYNPHFDKSNPPQLEYSYYCHGMEWGKECYSLEFNHGEIKEKQVIELEFGGRDHPTIEPLKKVVKDEKRCGFCNMLSKDVDVLIERDFLHRICNECVDECVKVINEQNA